MIFPLVLNASAQVITRDLNACLICYFSVNVMFKFLKMSSKALDDHILCSAPQSLPSTPRTSSTLYPSISSSTLLLHLANVYSSFRIQLEREAFAALWTRLGSLTVFSHITLHFFWLDFSSLHVNHLFGCLLH